MSRCPTSLVVAGIRTGDDEEEEVVLEKKKNKMFPRSEVSFLVACPCGARAVNGLDSDKCPQKFITSRVHYEPERHQPRKSH